MYRIRPYVSFSVRMKVKNSKKVPHCMKVRENYRYSLQVVEESTIFMSTYGIWYQNPIHQTYNGNKIKLNSFLSHVVNSVTKYHPKRLVMGYLTLSFWCVSDIGICLL